MRSGFEGRVWAVYSSASGNVLIACGAFWLSFVALADLAVRSGIPEAQAWIWPLLVDGLIVVSTVSVVALDGHRTAWYPWSLLILGALVSVAANGIHAVVAADTDVPGVLAGSVASVPPLVLLASTHLTVVLIRSTRTTPTPHTHLAPSSHAEPDAKTPIPAAPASVPVPDEEPVPVPESDEPIVDPDDPKTDEPDTPGDRRTEAARLRAEHGWSNKRIARVLDVHPSTVGRWLPRPTTEPADAEAIGPESSSADIAGADATDPQESAEVGRSHLSVKEETP